ncbi:hypothetical protein AN958_03750 [Leucoagaricus sp. SymC.cos]|nr:hypothetical protein AN958_03750 [Leucoagaricus sp. SymC.cos]
MFDSRKRKRQLERSNRRNHGRNDHDHPHIQDPEQDPTLFIQAYEADLRRGPRARELAKSLEIGYEPQSSQSKVGSALILWADGSGPLENTFDEDREDTISFGAKTSTKDTTSTEATPGIWVDRYDARLLLDALPDFESLSTSTMARSTPGSPSGWSDLPSDTEETFFFSPEEAEDYRHEKRRRLLEQAHEERLKARMEEEKEEVQEEVDEDPWGGSDEEPDDTQKELMRRTATHLLSSPNPAQLEMRILANHGYDSDSDEASGEAENQNQKVPSGEKADEASEEMKKEVRRQKAKEWAERRRAEANEAETKTSE